MTSLVKGDICSCHRNNCPCRGDDITEKLDRAFGVLRPECIVKILEFDSHRKAITKVEFPKDKKGWICTISKSDLTLTTTEDLLNL
jgi:hypothetical protein